MTAAITIDLVELIHNGVAQQHVSVRLVDIVVPEAGKR